MKTTNLGTELSFWVIDCQGANGFIYGHEEDRVVSCKYTGAPVRRRNVYLVRADEEGWRIDLEPPLGPLEAVYGVDGADHWFSPEAAAEALQARLAYEAENTTICGR